MQSKDEVLYTYQRVFKYLTEMLTPDEFQSLTFYNVNRMIDIVFRTKVAPFPLPEPKTLRNFIYDALDFNYVQTEKSRALLNPDENIKLCFAKQLWHDCQNLDMGLRFNANRLKKPHVFSKTNLRLHNQLDSYVFQNKKVAKAQEVELPVILGKEYFDQRENL
jgi:hypothetical protein